MLCSNKITMDNDYYNENSNVLTVDILCIRKVDSGNFPRDELENEQEQCEIPTFHTTCFTVLHDAFAAVKDLDILIPSIEIESSNIFLSTANLKNELTNETVQRRHIYK